MATIVAESVSYEDVNAAVIAADPGDTVQIPSGTAEWDSTLSATKDLIIRGDGIGNTVIKNGQVGAGAYVMNYIPSNPSSSSFFKLSHMTIDGQWQGAGLTIRNLKQTLAELVENVRLHDIRFVECVGRAIDWQGLIHGLIDNNIFYDCQRLIAITGRDWYSWPYGDPPDNTWGILPAWLGTGHCVCMEDNIIEQSGAQETDGVMVAGGNGCRYIFRHNTIQIPNFSGFWPQIFDAHGNQEPVTAPYGPSGSRGTVWTEISNNIINCDDVSGFQFFYHRGGIALVYNNTVTGVVSIGSISWGMTEEDKPEDFNYLAEYPGYDRVKETYCWNNTYNAASFIPSIYDAEDAYWIQEDRDYFLYEKPGYTPYTYPHPLRGLGSSSKLVMLLR